LLGILVVAAAVALWGPGRAEAAVCQSSGPAAGAYTANVCITAPADGAIVTGGTPTTATVTFTGTPPTGIQRVIFSLDGQYLLTDYSSPYSFMLPSARFVDGAHTLSATALMRDAFTASAASIALTFSNGVIAPPVNTNTFTPPTATPPPGQPLVLGAAGDGAGGDQSEQDVVSLIESWNPNLFLYLGDVYEKGSPTEYDNWYAPPGNYGDLRPITLPTVGNHEYNASSQSAPGYFDYWDNVPHSFSTDAGGWHLVSIDANGVYGQVAVGTPQYDWLANDLATRSKPCTLVFYHQPRFNIGQEGDTPSLQDVWALMAQHGVDVVLSGHDHTYQRWVSLDANGNPAAGGINQFVIGTGGHALGSFVRQSSLVAAQANQFGAFRLDLRPNGADYRFITAGSTTLDSGALQCSGTTADMTPPTAPGDLTANSPAYNQVDLSWTESTDDVGVAGYDIYRDGTKVAAVGLVNTYSDRSVAPGTTYQYTVQARDAARNLSPQSNAVSVESQVAVTQFSDDFETGDLSKWTSVTGLVVQSTTKFDGAYAAEATSTGSPAFADATLATPQTNLFVRTRFFVASQGTNPANLIKLKTATNGKLVTLLLGSTGKLSYRNDQTAVTELSATVPTRGTWHKLELHVVANGASSLVEVWLDDVLVPDLGGPDSLGTNPAGILELGDASAARTFDVVFDNVNAVVSARPDSSSPSVPTDLSAVASSGPQVDLTWGASTDNIGVTGYDVYRDGTLLASLGATTGYADKTVSPHTSYSYQVLSRDLAGNTSALSPAVSTSVGGVVSDGFESGTLGGWTTVNGLTVQQQLVYTGSWAARATSTGAPAVATKTLSAPFPELFYRVRFQIVSKGANSANLLRFRTATGSAIATLSLSTTGKLVLRNDVGAIATTASTAPSMGVWHEVEAHIRTGATGLTEVWYDGVKVDSLTRTESLGANPVGRLELGDASSGRTLDVAFDNVAVDSGFLGESTPPTPPTNLTAHGVTPTRIDLGWTAATDNVGVTGYAVYRDGMLIATISAVTSYSDTSALPGTTYTYAVRAFDAAGNSSDPSGSATATSGGTVVLSESFESGNLSSWATVVNTIVQSQEVYAGTWAARAVSTGNGAFANKSLPAPRSNGYYRVRFKIVSQGANPANLIKLRTGFSSMVGVYVEANGKLSLRNDVASITAQSTTAVSAGSWHQLLVHAAAGGNAASQTEVWLDGVRVDALTRNDTLGTTAVARVEIGDRTTTRTFDLAFDDLVVTTP
jgi:fibronectin type 3 domain-containing protein